ncbi:SRPBCC family protein [Flammeovirga sp. MY04]|uniref:SRPBCC family protein n=1 Tax=Flammeovirga sp. MY04 TaxID=1191459 RepID=UPI0008060D4C|nr:SRPBCC family protein [Flammeovirga sp. MY04]ANQ52101.1 SRPBCC family protein [Flammeovirga sp. MY04]
MAFYQFKKDQRIAASIDEVWDFISSPKNLKEITPDYMGFDITNGDLPDKMHEGMIITYKVSPLLGIKMDWMTEITHVRDKQYFVDEQRIGPYDLWHHQHIIKEIHDGVLMEDIVTYAPPFGPLGAIANALVIENKLEEIFKYRRKVINKKWGELPDVRSVDGLAG